ncbi:MAG: hypothetical protein PVSMB1_16850 [Gemmatimonadaceae bacterium]
MLEGGEGLARPVGSPLLSDFVTDYLSAAEEEHVTYNKDTRVLAQCQRFIGDRRLTDISQFAIEKWKISRAKQVTRSTVNRELNVVKGLLSRAVEWKKRVCFTSGACQKV